jgi:alpha-mannosidase
MERVESVALEPVDDGTGNVRVRITQQPSQRLLVRAVDVPGFGWRAWDPAGADALDVPPVSVSDQDTVLDNGLVRVVVGADGTFAIDGLSGFGQIVRDGDVGDTYNWCPPQDDTIIDRPLAVAVEVLERGPLRGRVRIRATYPWPVETEVTTTLELLAGERLVRVVTKWDNRSRDQRVRAWFPLPTPTDHSRAECSFAVVKRGLTAEGGPTELGLPTFPSRRFVQAGELTIVHEGLLEYELVDINDGRAHALALTLARCTGMLSQGPMSTRPMPAGPLTRMEGPQMQVPIEVRYAVQVGDADPFALVDDAFLPLRTTSAGNGDRPSSGQALSVSGAQVSSLRRVAGRLELRVFNPSDQATTVTVDGHDGWLIDLRGRPIAAFSGAFDLAPWRIATARLDDSGH